MDGNGRWAKKRGLARSMGHKAGADNLLSLCKDCHAKIHKNFAALSDKQQQFIIDKELQIKNKYDRLCIPLDYSNIHHRMDHEDNYNDRLNKLLLDKSKGDCDKMSLFS